MLYLGHRQAIIKESGWMKNTLIAKANAQTLLFQSLLNQLIKQNKKDQFQVLWLVTQESGRMKKNL